MSLKNSPYLKLVLRKVDVFCHLAPVDGSDVAQLEVATDENSAVDAGQADEAQLLKVTHLHHHEGVAVEQRLAANHRQVGEHMP